MNEIESKADGGTAAQGPNFKLILGLFVLVILLVLIAALFFSAYGERLLHPQNPDPHPTSRLVLPIESASTRQA